MANLLVRLARYRNAGLLFISHDLGIVRHICDDIACRVHRTKTHLFVAHARSGTLAPRSGVPDLVADLVDALWAAEKRGFAEPAPPPLAPTRRPTTRTTQSANRR